MQVLVVLVTRHSLALRMFAEHGVQILNPTATPQATASGLTLIPRSYDPQRVKEVSFERFVLQRGEYAETLANVAQPEYDGVVVLYEASSGHLLASVRNAIFAGEVPSMGYMENVRNFLIDKFSTLLRNYAFLRKKMQDATAYQAACLPIRNFNAAELREFLEVCRARSLEKTFQNYALPSLNKLISLRGPKRRSNYPHVFFKDQHERYFKYGHERHSRYETSTPHDLSCDFNGRFRFGSPLDQDRHYNVTVGDSDATKRISCDSSNCHDELVEVRSRTHINMFSNDFHK
jgi:hypothetical protein